MADPTAHHVNAFTGDRQAAFDVDLARTRLVIFDFDGVVVDSEIKSLTTLQAALETFGLSYGLDEVRERFLGSSLRSIGDYVAKHSAAGTSVGLADAWQTRLFAEFRAGLSQMPGLVAFLDRPDAWGTGYCIASSSSFERLGVALSAAELGERFDHVFSAEQVAHGKPAPDLFLFAAEHMDVDPTECLVIEDSVHGIRAAQAAGMRAVGFVGGTHLARIEGAHAADLQAHGAIGAVATFGDLFSNSDPAQGSG